VRWSFSFSFDFGGYALILIISSTEHGEIDLTTQVNNVKLVGPNGMQFISSTDGKVIFEIQAEDPKLRDTWVLSLNEMLQEWSGEWAVRVPRFLTDYIRCGLRGITANPEKKPKQSISAAGTSNKAEYFKQREEELKAREKQNQEKRSKYSAGGMKFTAQVMASRG